MVDLWVFFWAAIGVIAGTAIWNMVMRNAQNMQQKLILALGFYRIYTAMAVGALWALILGYDPLGIAKYMAAFVAGLTVHFELPQKKVQENGE